MVSELANLGVMMHNWPHGVRWPGAPGSDDGAKANKGIAGLGSTEQKLLLQALKDEKRPLHFQKLTKDEDRRSKSLPPPCRSVS